AAGGQQGVERAVGLLRDEVERSMALLGCRTIAELRPDKIRYRGRTAAYPNESCLV
ncbi:MAG: alpha-hydroxy-acid oxidizing protein, partial [Exilibacterium sp.]